MSDTLPNTTLAADTWVDLYAATGVGIGSTLLVQNIGSTTVRLHTGAVSPTGTPGYVLIQPNLSWRNEAGDSGAWAYSPLASGVLNVSEVA